MENNQITVETCRSCKEPLLGRKDKQFCDDSCRVRHHRHKTTQVLGSVDRVLHLNRHLLKKMRVHRATASDPVACFMELRRAGFDFNFHTHVEGMVDGRLAVMCYDEGYAVRGNGIEVLPVANETMLASPHGVSQASTAWSDVRQLRDQLK
jgi:hypothetical protein